MTVYRGEPGKLPKRWGADPARCSSKDGIVAIVEEVSLQSIFPSKFKQPQLERPRPQPLVEHPQKLAMALAKQATNPAGKQL